MRPGQAVPRDGPASAPRLKLVARDGSSAELGDDPSRRRVTSAEVGGYLARVVEAVDKQRRMLERDLHDGVQQRLVEVRIRLELAGERAADEAALRGTLAEIGEDLDEAIDELREIAHGIHPQVLTDYRLAPALAHVARAAARPVAIASAGVARHPAKLESAI
jgi:signal transduction histidine kinase